MMELYQKNTVCHKEYNLYGKSFIIVSKSAQLSHYVALLTVLCKYLPSSPNIKASRLNIVQNGKIKNLISQW